MKTSYMSSEHSVSGSDDDQLDDESGSDLENQQPVKARRFTVNGLDWRTTELENVFSILDKKVARKRHGQAKRMVFERVKGRTSSRKPPLDAPAWAVKGTP